MAIISGYPSEEREKYIGWCFTAGGIGLITGPLFAAVFYQIGGISAAFFTSSLIYFFLVIILARFIKLADYLGR